MIKLDKERNNFNSKGTQEKRAIMTYVACCSSEQQLLLCGDKGHVK